PQHRRAHPASGDSDSVTGNDANIVAQLPHADNVFAWTPVAPSEYETRASAATEGQMFLDASDAPKGQILRLLEQTSQVAGSKLVPTFEDFPVAQQEAIFEGADRTTATLIPSLLKKITGEVETSTASTASDTSSNQRSTHCGDANAPDECFSARP